MKELPEAVRSRLQPVDRTLDTLETPAVLIDADIADANLRRWQERCDRAGLANRPHIKTHRTAAWALRQVELGAKGITVQTVGEAEVMADAGINDLFLTTNTLGAAKLARLGAVAKRSNLSVVADSREVVDAVAARGQGRRCEAFACWSNATPAAAVAASPIRRRSPNWRNTSPDAKA